jgi:hypothetical protein
LIALLGVGCALEQPTLKQASDAAADGEGGATERDSSSGLPEGGDASESGALDAGGDARACPAGLMDCNPAVAGCETDVSWSENCGSCSHDCRGGTCSSGVCQAVAIAKDLRIPRAPVVDENGKVYFTETAVAATHTACVTRMNRNGAERLVLYELLQTARWRMLWRSTSSSSTSA